MAFLFDASEKTVTVEVGSSATLFKVHESVLCASSEFLKTKNKPEWTQGGSNVKLPHHSAELFNVYVNWLYSRTVETPNNFQLLASAYVLGEALMDTKFKDSVITAFYHSLPTCSEQPFWENAGDVIKIIYEGTPETSPARKFLVDIFADYSSSDEMALSYDSAPKKFFFDVARAAGMGSELGEFQPDDLCHYHGHALESPCYLNPDDEKRPE